MANEKAARWDFWRFLSLKIPGLLAAAFAAFFAYIKWDTVDYLAAAIALLCANVDAFARPGSKRTARVTAHYELRLLAHQIHDQWQRESLDGKDSKVVGKLIFDRIIEEKARIMKYLKDAVAPLD